MTATARRPSSRSTSRCSNNLTVTPTFNLKNDNVHLWAKPARSDQRSIYAAGVEPAYAATPDARFLFSYMNEQRSQNVLSSNT